MSMVRILEQIKNGEVVLPAIQRSFVWDDDKITKLLDSIARGYPIGITLLWETFDDIQFRYFKREFLNETPFVINENNRRKRLRIVLDGQQRLQSLYIALYGSLDSRYLYFDLLSEAGPNDFAEDRYKFLFLRPADARSRNLETRRARKNQADPSQTEFDGEYLVRFSDIIEASISDQRKIARTAERSLGLVEQEVEKIEENIATIWHNFVENSNILKWTVIDEGLPRSSKQRKSESDILEAFVRINREGVPLSRSDLIFSMLKLKWRESAESLPRFVVQINKGNSFELDEDFVIRCLFVVAGLGSKFDVDMLRRRENIDRIKSNYKVCCRAIESTIDFVQDHCGIASSKLLGGYYNLVPIVYYLSKVPGHVCPDREVENLRKAVFLFGFIRPFSRYADSRLWRFVRDELSEISEPYSFPLKEALYWMKFWENIDNFGPEFLQRNVNLTLHLVQSRSGGRVQYIENAPHVDHIFPRSVLRKRGLTELEVNHFANFWILERTKNFNKSNRHPKEYFANVSKGIKKQAFIEDEFLNYQRFRTFLSWRQEKILKKVKSAIRLRQDEFKVDRYWGDYF